MMWLRGFRKKTGFSSLMILAVLAGLTVSGCKLGHSPGGDEGSGTGSLCDQTNGNACNPNQPKVVDFFTGADVTVQKDSDRYAKFVGHLGGFHKAYIFSGDLSAVNLGSSVHVVKGTNTPLNFPPAGTVLAENLDLKSPIQSMAFASFGGAKKLLVGTRSNFQVLSVGDSSVAVDSAVDVLGPVSYVAFANNQAYLVNAAGDLYQTSLNGCFYRLYEGASDVDSGFNNHRFIPVKVVAAGDGVAFLTQNHRPFEYNLTDLITLVTSKDFLKWRNKVRYVNLKDKSKGELNLSTPSTPDVSPSDLASTQDRLYVAVNSFPASVYDRFAACLQNPGTCPGPLSDASAYFMVMYVFGDAGVMQLPWTNLSQVPEFRYVETNLSLPVSWPGLNIPFQMNTGLFYSPRIAVDGDNLYMRGVGGASVLKNLSQNNTVWDYRYAYNNPPAHLKMSFNKNLEVSQGIFHLTGLEGVSDYAFDVDQMKGVNANSAISPIHGMVTDVGRDSIYSTIRRFSVVDSKDKNSFDMDMGTFGTFVGTSFIKGADEAADRYLIAKRETANLKIRLFKTKQAPAASPITHDSEVNVNLGGSHFLPFLSEYQLMTGFRSDSAYTFYVQWDLSMVGNKYDPVLLKNSENPLLNPISVTTPSPGGISGLPFGFHRLVVTDSSYILYVSKIDGAAFKVDRLSISKSSVSSGTPSAVLDYSLDLSSSPSFGIDADDKKIYVIDVHGKLTTYDAQTGAPVGSAVNVFNYSSGTFFFPFPNSLVVKGQGAYVAGMFLGVTPLRFGVTAAQVNLANSQVTVFSEPQYMMVNGSDQLAFTPFMNENGVEVFNY
ncbi:MAG: hypothetical protein U1F57_09095 [bacterium]